MICLWQPYVEQMAEELLTETKGFMCATQDGVVTTRVYKKLIMKQRMNNDQCRISHSALETLDYFMSGFTVMALVKCMNRHNAVYKKVRQHIGSKHGRITIISPVY